MYTKGKLLFNSHRKELGRTAGYRQKWSDVTQCRILILLKELKTREHQLQRFLKGNPGKQQTAGRNKARARWSAGLLDSARRPRSALPRPAPHGPLRPPGDAARRVQPQRPAPPCSSLLGWWMLSSFKRAVLFWAIVSSWIYHFIIFSFITSTFNFYFILQLT